MRDRHNSSILVMEWVLGARVLSASTMHRFDVFSVCLWALWMKRNNVVWKGSSFHPGNSIQWAMKFLANFQKLHSYNGKTRRRMQTFWKCPPSGRLKIHVDGAYQSELGSGRISVVLWNEIGACVAAFSRYFPHVSSTIHIEAEACKAGLLIAIHHG